MSWGHPLTGVGRLQLCKRSTIILTSSCATGGFQRLSRCMLCACAQLQCMLMRLLPSSSIPLCECSLHYAPGAICCLHIGRSRRYSLLSWPHCEIAPLALQPYEDVGCHCICWHCWRIQEVHFWSSLKGFEGICLMTLTGVRSVVYLVLLTLQQVRYALLSMHT